MGFGGFLDIRCGLLDLDVVVAVAVDGVLRGSEKSFKVICFNEGGLLERDGAISHEIDSD